MRVTFDPSNLRDALKIVSKGIPNRTNLPVMGMVLIEADKNGGVTFATTNSTIYIKTNVYGVNVEKAGSICVPFKKLNDFAAKMQAPIVLTDDSQNLKVNLECGTFKAKNIDCLDAADFPFLTIPEWTTSIEMEGDEFVKRVSRALISATHKDDSQGKESLVFYVNDGKLALICRDTYRMSYVNGMEVGGTDGEYVVPEDAMNKAVAIAAEFPSTIVHLSDKRVCFEWNGASLYSLLLSFKFSYAMLEYLQAQTKQRITVNRTELERALAVNRIFSNDQPRGMEDVLRFDVGENNLRIYSDEKAFGDAVVEADVQGEIKPFVASCPYIQDFLKVADTDNVVMEIDQNTNVIFLKPQDDDDFVNMLAPIAVKGAAE